jgi:hypothetical protein
LLQNNRIATLPVELGLVDTLTTLSLAENPLYYPDEEVNAVYALRRIAVLLV